MFPLFTFELRFLPRIPCIVLLDCNASLLLPSFVFSCFCYVVSSSCMQKVQMIRQNVYAALGFIAGFLLSRPSSPLRPLALESAVREVECGPNLEVGRWFWKDNEPGEVYNCRSSRREVFWINDPQSARRYLIKRTPRGLLY